MIFSRQLLENAVSYATQTDKTDAEKAQARKNIAAAPSGYGYGDAITFKSWDDADGSVFEAFVDQMIDETDKIVRLTDIVDYPANVVSGNGGFADIKIDTNGYAIVLFHGPVNVTEGTLDGVYHASKKRLINGTWLPWEYDNPPFAVGVVYRTTDRYEGNVVYKMLASNGIIQWSIDEGATWKPESDFIGAASTTDLAKKPNAVQVYTTLHVAKTGSDETGNGTEAAPYLTIQKAINSLPKLLLERVIIRVHEGTYDEDVFLSSFDGFENLVLQGAAGESVQVKTVYVYQCTPSVSVENLTLTSTLSSQSNSSLVFSRCRDVLANQITCTGTVASAERGAFLFNVVGLARVINCVISNKPIAIDINGATVYLNSTDTGTGNTVGIRCGSAYGQIGGYVQKGGATIAGEEQKGYGGQIW